MFTQKIISSVVVIVCFEFEFFSIKNNYLIVYFIDLHSKH